MDSVRLKECDILLFPAKGWIEKLIAWGTDSLYCHVGVITSARLGIMIEAGAGRVHATAVANLHRDYDVYRVKSKYDYQKDRVIHFLTLALNSRYDYLGVAYLGILKLLGKCGINTKDAANKWQKSRDYFCSELVHLAFIAGGLDLVPGIPDSDVVSPADIAVSKYVKMEKQHKE